MARILFLIIGFEKPSSKKRVLGSLEFLHKAGHEAVAMEVRAGLPGRLAMLARLPRYDLVVIQKKLFGKGMLRLMKAANPNMLFDLDDAVMFHELERGERLSGRHFSRFAECVSACKGVIAGNSYLAGFARAAGADTVVLPTPVDTSAITPRSGYESDAPVIGWMGTKGNLSHLKAIERALVRVAEENPGVSLKVVSDKRPEMAGINISYKPWSAGEEKEDLASFDIGVMPLADDIWTRGKGGFKLLQYMAAGVPAVASPVGINADIIRDGENGMLAADEDSWVKALGTLARDAGLRKRLGEAGRRTAEESYSLDAYNRGLAAFIQRFV